MLENTRNRDYSVIWSSAVLLKKGRLTGESSVQKRNLNTKTSIVNMATTLFVRSDL